ncbi:hypothetical protein GCK72_018737 [Caenorhabditis remanei]|uniref:valine--tRNA ligase n=1 Tax=Caenorhabditis remanei TaxID=31234 RepID=A0A6A5GBZ9_CAERE|nr:hypothetical protein GCK72_018737 [Caenorhabditis remanei]KAF1752183.1 hypothetical protein GCK72_018737 [Caenorhabditis remanei]
MVLPPPNVTGKLHLGHALTVAVEDAICRHQRNQGNRAEWIPGFDHAGIATQVVVEKILAKRGKRRQNMSREEFVQECHSWSEKCSAEIRQQLCRMGASLDWNQSYYTLDPKFSSAVTKAFCILEKDGLITRGKRMVHWCPTLSSTLSTQEVNRIDVPSNSYISVPSADGKKRKIKFGQMHLIRYKVVDSDSEFVEVGTTRPETLFADVAIAVHPNDDRYSKLHGKYVWSPVTAGRKLLVITDSAVSIEKGTGAVKITPSHDPLDFDIWNRWKSQNSTSEIEEFLCIDENGKMTNCAENILGIDRFEARERVIEMLSSSDDYKGLIKHEGAQVNICSRTGDVIEPRLTEQWFLDCKDMFIRSAEALKTGQIEVFPEYQSHRLIEWFENQEPWCLSRQLWWGHRIPAYHIPGQEKWIVTADEKEARQQLGDQFVQDQDVLDTWFSSSLVPLVKNGWLEGEQIQIPSLNVMETGWDISGFWVARMIALNLKLSNGESPFGKVVLHGLVRDNEGRKMSKSLGNVIDPVDVLDGISYEKMVERVKESALEQHEIENAVTDLTKMFPKGIARCGPDALRFALLKYDVLATDIPLDVSNVSLDGLHFCNKLWNLAAYYDQLAEKSEVIKDVDSDRLIDVWIMARLSSTVAAVDGHMNKFSLHLALSTLHKFITSDICDIYLESTKKALWSNDIGRIRQARSTLQRVLQPTLVQLNAFMPFVSEYLYERIFSREPGSILFDVVKPSLFIFHRNEELEEAMKLITAVMASVRSTRQKLQLSPKLIFSGILEMKPSDMTPSDIKRLADEVTQTCGLELQKVCREVDEDVKKDFIACPVPGHDAKLWLRIDSESKEAFIDSLKKQLEKIITRQEQFEAKVVSYESICANPNTKPLNALKTKRKAENARKVVENAKEEATRIEHLISSQSK